MGSGPGTENDAPLTVLSLAPNCALSEDQARLFMGSLIFGTLLVSGSIALAGFWLVLPFAGLELLAVGYALSLSMKRGRYKEVLRVFNEQLVVEKGVQSVEERVEFPRYWTTVRLVPSRVTSYPSRLIVSCMGKSLEIGEFLTEPERVGLGKRLTSLIGPVETLPSVSAVR
ncbi:MAG: DUF2244 domain-containing protein [Gammaproteobacteria bacterium]